MEISQTTINEVVGLVVLAMCWMMKTEKFLAISGQILKALAIIPATLKALPTVKISEAIIAWLSRKKEPREKVDNLDEITK